MRKEEVDNFMYIEEASKLKKTAKRETYGRGALIVMIYMYGSNRIAVRGSGTTAIAEPLSSKAHSCS